MSDNLTAFLAPSQPGIRDLAWKLRAIIREVIPEAIEQLDLPAHPIDDGSDRMYKGAMDGEQQSA